MRRLALYLAVLASALLSLGFTGTAKSHTRIVYVRSTATTVSYAEIKNALPAFQAALDEDFGPAWRVHAKLVFIGHAQAPKGSWRVKIEDYVPCWGCAGFHENAGGTVRAEVGTEAGWQVTFSHELFELLADPYVHGDGSHARIWRVGQSDYIVETADPVEAFSYTRLDVNGVPVQISDFVTPAWFDATSTGNWDFMGRTTGPLQILKGGYQLIWHAGGTITSITNW